jgi:hypothetical protein
MKDAKRSFTVIKPNVKWSVVFLLCSSQIAWPQVKTGTVLFINFTPSDLTIAADSRVTLGGGGYNDTECKISAFGDKFVFVMAGAVFSTDDLRNPHSIARQIWELNSLTEQSAKKLVPVIAEEWVARMEQIYAQSGQIGAVKKHMGGEVLANAFFAATDSMGQLAIVGVNIDFDGQLFDTSGQIHITHNIRNLPPDSWASGGLDEVADEYRLETSVRAKEYMSQFRTEILSLSPLEQRARLAAKYVEMSILLHPRKAELGFPIDVLQLKPGTGVNWVSIKANCPQN